MFYGHIGVALASKPLAKNVSLGLLLTAVTLLDILAGIFMVIGIEYADANGLSVIPWSHGLFMAIMWSILTFILVYIFMKSIRNGIILGVLVFSHWFLDFISHPMGMGEKLPPDLPLFFSNSQKIGLGLYNSMPAAFITEFGLLIIGLVIYLKTSRATDSAGKWSLIVLLLFLAIMPLMMFIPENLIFITTFSLLFLLPIGIWMDRHRIMKA